MWTFPVDGQAVRGRRTGAGTLIYSVTTGWPSGLTGLWRRKPDSSGRTGGEGGGVPFTSSGPKFSSHCGDIKTLSASAAAVSYSENTGATTPINMRWS